GTTAETRLRRPRVRVTTTDPKGTHRKTRRQDLAASVARSWRWRHHSVAAAIRSVSLSPYGLGSATQILAPRRGGFLRAVRKCAYLTVSDQDSHVFNWLVRPRELYFRKETD